MRSPLRISRLILAAALAATGASCKSTEQVRSFVAEPFPDTLAEWRLFRGTGAKLEPSERVLPYDVNAPLFSDYAQKSRTVWMPPGQSASYRESGVLELPAGTILTKTFAFGAQVIETRLLVRTAEGWVALPYLWNEEQTEARLERIGSMRQIRWTPPSGEAVDIHYQIPNTNQCLGCHERDKALSPIGIQARQLNRDFAYADGRENQLSRWVKAGYLQGVPADPKAAPRLARWDDPESGTLEARARAYLESNCAHCHETGRPAAPSGLYLSASEPDPHRLGVCKVPVAAGRGSGKDLEFDVVPGKPELSILHHRMASLEPGVMMPELGRGVVHSEGVALIGAWIQSLKGSCEPL